MIETADRQFGRPRAGRRSGDSDLQDFIDQPEFDGLPDAQLALEWAERHPEKYPLGEFDPAIDTLKETIRKIRQRQKAKAA